MVTDSRRYRIYQQGSHCDGPVLYWMHRNFRVKDNWGLLHAQEEALRRSQPVLVAFCLSTTFLDATLRHYEFLLKGLEEISSALAVLNIPLLIRIGDPESEIRNLCRQVNPGLVITDFDPLRIKRKWLHSLCAGQAAPVHEVDSRNIVPCWLASEHREFMARTIRPKIRNLLAMFLTPFPELLPHPFRWQGTSSACEHATLAEALSVDRRVGPVKGVQPGETAAARVLTQFIDRRLSAYELRNDPNLDVCSHLSPYLHFGMISAQRIVLEMQERGLSGTNVESFLEELVVRRELAENFCLYCQDYDRFAGFPEWARASLRKHQNDQRPFLYSEDLLERAETHDRLWNAAQRQMMETGRMHGYMRMYWAKKMLEWTEEPAQAQQIAIRLNDRYSLDGRDPNGYAGIAWSIGGVHDRGWPERPIFGKVRYMNDRGMARKFDIERYIRRWTSGGEGGHVRLT